MPSRMASPPLRKRSRGTFAEHVASAVDEGADHGAELGGEDAAFDLALGDAEALNVFGGDVTAGDLGVANAVLPEVV